MIAVAVAVALALLAVGGAGFVARLVIGPNLSDRVVSLDALLTVVVTAVTAWGAATRRTTFVMLGVVVSVVGFLGTCVFARYVEGRRR